MAVPSQPADPQRHSTYPGATTPRPPTTDTVPSPPILPVDHLHDYANPPQPQDAPPQTVDSLPPANSTPQPAPTWQTPRYQERGPAPNLTAQQRLLLLDTWRRSGLPVGDFAALVGLSKHTLYAWKRKFEAEGPAGLEDKPHGGPHGSRLPDITQRAILMIKQGNPDWGGEKISALLLRSPGLPAHSQAVARVLHEAGYCSGRVVFHEKARGQASNWPRAYLLWLRVPHLPMPTSSRGRAEVRPPEGARTSHSPLSP